MTAKTVVMPNGLEVEGVPEGTSQQVIIDDLIRQGVITPEVGTSWLSMEEHIGPEDPSNPMPESDFSVSDFLLGNLDVPLSILGGIGGTIAGAVGGPPGAAAGGVAGSAGGTFLGEVLSDYFTSDEIDLDDATKNTLISGGMDVATLGAMKVFKPLAKAMGFSADEMLQLWNKYTGKAPEGEALPVGSPESLVQTQNLLQPEGGSLTAFQTGQASGTRRVTEGIGEIGVLSGSYYGERATRNAEIIAERINTMIQNTVDGVSDNRIGETILGIIQGGKKAAQTSYNASMDEIISRIGNRQVNPKWIEGTIKKFIKDNTKDFGVDLDPDTLKLLNEWSTKLVDLDHMSVDSLLALQKRVNTQINALSEFGSTQNTTAARELAELSSRLRQTTEALLKNVDEASYDAYKAANLAYGGAMDGLVPKLNANVISRADKGDYEAISRVLEGKNPDQIEAFMKSIDEAYTQARLAGIDPKDLNITSPEAARAAIRRGWLKNIFGESMEEGFDPNRFARLADFYEKPANARAAKAILGEQFGEFKMLLNAMNEISRKQPGFVGSLVLRSKEAQGVSGLLQGAAAIPTAGTVLFGPMMLARIASNPAAVRRLLEGTRSASLAYRAGKTATVSEIMDKTLRSVMELFSEEEQAEIRNTLR